MDHIRQFDWCSTSTQSRYFVDETALDNCSTEKILKNRFFDPLISSDEEEQALNVIDWDKIFKTKQNNRVHKVYCPGLRHTRQYPKLSILTGAQHFQCLKVLCTMYPHVLEEQTFPKPTVVDRRAFEVLAEVYENEQKEYIEWAKSIWTSQHCIRAIRPKPVIETTYEAEFKIKAYRMSSYPKRFEMAAQIPLESTRRDRYDFNLRKELVAVNLMELPAVEVPQPILKSSTVIGPCSIPEPCHKHPYPFILPNETSVSMLPITEIHHELAVYAAENDTRFIASENSLRCLVEFNRHWTIPLTVCSELTPDGERCNVVVLDSEFSIHKEPAMIRSFKAFRHLLEQALIPSSERDKVIEKWKGDKEKEPEQVMQTSSLLTNDPESSEDERMGLCIDEEDDDDANDSYLYDGDDITKNAQIQDNARHFKVVSEASCKNNFPDGNMSMDAINDIIGVYSCTCTDTPYEIPPRRSFKKWNIRNRTDSLDMIVHCSHKARNYFTELILEPIPEYQLELGGSELSPDRVRSLALALLLRKDASLLNVRLDGMNGDMIRFDTVPWHQFLKEHAEKTQEALNVVHTTLSELQGLLPGHYLLQHEPGHGANALLYVSRPHSNKLRLNFDSSQLIEPDEAKMVKTPPTLTPVLLPSHKFRKILPCAFTPFEQHLVKEPKKPAAKQKSPPQAIKSQEEPPHQKKKWPKKKNNKKKNNK